MSELSIFVDESGHFGLKNKRSPYYLLSFVFHDQSYDIHPHLVRFEQCLVNLGYPGHTVHTAPIIRKEKFYQTISLDDRRHLFRTLCLFARQCDISYKTFCFKKSECNDKLGLMRKMAITISNFIHDNKDWLFSYDRIILYYDNGQGEILTVLTGVFSVLLPHLEFRKVVSSEYRLFQVADLLCTIELVSKKISDTGELSNSERIFFENKTKFKKTYCNAIKSKSL